MITKCYATTSIDRSDYKILDVIQLTHDSHPLYGPEHLFPMLDAALNVDETAPGFENSVQYQLVSTIWNSLVYELTPAAASLEHRTTTVRLRQFLAVPVLAFNSQTFSQGTIPSDRGKTATFVSSSYRVGTLLYLKFNISC